MLGLRGRTDGLAHHTVTFPADYDAEFDDVFAPPAPRARPDGLRQRAERDRPGESAEGWFVLVNAPAIGDAADWEAEAERLIDRLGVRDRIEARALRTPGDLERETGGVAGAIYGVAPHGRLGTLRRPATTVRGVRGLWIARRDGAPRRRAAARRARRRARPRAESRRVRPLARAARGRRGAARRRGCGGEELVTDARRRRPRRRRRSSAPRGCTDDVPIVLFLHGWGATSRARTGPGSSTSPARATR